MDGVEGKCRLGTASGREARAGWGHCRDVRVPRHGPAGILVVSEDGIWRRSNVGQGEHAFPGDPYYPGASDVSGRTRCKKAVRMMGREGCVQSWSSHVNAAAVVSAPPSL